METYKQFVKTASDAFQRTPQLNTDAVRGLWNAVEWVVVEDLKHDPVTLSDTEPTITLAPSLMTRSADAAKLILTQFGLLVLRSGGEEANLRWDKKLMLPSERHVHTFVQKLASPEIRKTAKSYRDLLDTYPNVSSSVPKLVAINLANALIANNVPYNDSQGVNPYEWGPTVEYANRRKRGSILPLTSAYCPPDVNRCFGCAFADLATTKLNRVRESSVRVALTELIEDICEMIA